MSVEENKELVRRWVHAWNTNTNFEVVEDIFAQDWVDRNPIPGGPQGIEGVRHFVTTFRQAFSDVHLDIDLLLGEGDHVMFRWIANAVHTGPFLGVEPTGKRVRFSGITVHRVANGKFAESTAEIDLLGLLEQLQDTAPA
ncbi:MAG: ester cyclase [Chloroflexota bacterium]|nr:ester cyclase [Chloroflexota bacterium]MDQ5866309.1 ester cyclase [Chloroflexota bacterium]